ncbi:MAG: four helix bundle protein [Polyangia bacterium]|jgi:hypothetical protein|nr:four helix bundle protein [Polyangia bacterium]
MAGSQSPGPDLRLFEDWMDTTKWLLERTARFPKRLRASLTERVESLAIGILEDVTRAAYQGRGRKARTLEQADDRLSRLRVLIRLGHELEVLSHGQYEEAAVRLDGAGRMLGAWLRGQVEVPGSGGRAGGGSARSGRRMGGDKIRDDATEGRADV